MALVSDPTDSGFNAYASVSEADAYFADQLNTSAWDEAGDNKAKALVTATRVLDASFTWKGIKTIHNQPLDFPRAQVYDEDGYLFGYNEIPGILKQATYELGRSLLATGQDPFGDTTASITKLRAGPIALEFDTADKELVVKEAIRSLLRPIALSGGSDEFGQPEIARS